MEDLTLTPEPLECKGGARHKKIWTLSLYGIDEWMGHGPLPLPSL